MNLRKYKNPNFLWLLAISFFAILVPVVSHAGLISIFADIVAAVLISPFALLLELELSILTKIAEFNHFTDVSGVQAGWQVLRDLSNMFFIVILLIIAFATIIGIKGYGYKTLLSKLIIVAILINFSMAITAFFIDASQIIMLTFVSAISGLVEGNVIVALGIGDIVNIADTGGGSVGFGDVLAALLLGSFMLIITDVVIMMIILILVARIVTLWLAIVTAPISFLASAFPKTQSHFTKWQEDLSKNLITGPSLIFFVWLAFTIAGRGNLASTHSSFDENSAQGATGIVGGEQMFNFVIAISLLIAAIKMAQESGAAGAGMASKATNYLKGKAAQFGKNRIAGIKKKAGDKFSQVAGAAGAGIVDEKGRARKGNFLAKSKTFRRMAMKARTTDTKRQTERAEEELGKVSPSMRSEYIKSRQGQFAGKITGGEAKWNLAEAKQIASSGRLPENTEATDVYKTLQNAGDVENMKKMKSKFASIHTDKDSARSFLEEEGLSSLGKMKRDSFNSSGGQNLIQTVLEEYTPKDINKALKGMDQKTADAILDVMSSGLGNLQIEDEVDGDGNVTRPGVFNGDGELNENALTTQVVTVAQNSPDKLGELKLDESQLKSLAEKASIRMDFSKLARLDINDPKSSQIFNALTVNANMSQQRQMLEGGGSDKHTEQMVKNLEKQEKRIHRELRGFTSKGGDEKKKTKEKPDIILNPTNADFEQAREQARKETGGKGGSFS